MINKLKVKMWGMEIGDIFLSEDGQPVFKYNSSFIEKGIEISPLKCKLSKKAYVFPELNYSESPFKGLPGFIADVMPDKFGNELIKEWLKTQKRSESDLTILERLSYVGKRGLGAIEFEPIINEIVNDNEKIKIDEIHSIVEKILEKKLELNEKNVLSGSLTENNIKQIISIGTSAGGARAKAIISLKKESDGIYQIKAGGFDENIKNGYTECLIKFDSALNSDKEEKDGTGHTNVEFGYYLMTKDCDIKMASSELLKQENSGLYHFVTERFDRNKIKNIYNSYKKHVITLNGLLHNDFNKSRTLDYVDVFNVLDQICENPSVAKENKIEFFKRMVFNVIFRNQDDHSKNTSFIMDEKGKWNLAPFYDVTFAYSPTGKWTSKHQMTILSYSDNEEITRDILLEVAKKVNLPINKCNSIIDKTLSVADNFEKYMRLAEVKEDRILKMKQFIHQSNDKNFCHPNKEVEINYTI